MSSSSSGDGTPPTGSSLSELDIASNALSECLFSQYAFTLAGVVGGTGYALYRKPPNGLGLMLVAGAAGTMADLAYAWSKACQPQVDMWLKARENPATASKKNTSSQESN